MARTDNHSSEPSRAATVEDVRHVLGELEEIEVAHIMALRPTYGELSEAALWARGDGDLAAREARDLSDAAIAIASIIVAADDAESAEER